MLRLGTRSSPLALAQAVEVKKCIESIGVQVEIHAITTSGDKIKDKPLEPYGGKVLFTKEIEQSLFDNEIDIAVHSVKDIELSNPYDLVIGGVLAREDPRDVFISGNGERLLELPSGASIGTASPRRSAQALLCRPDVQIKLIRGNVQTRLHKVNNKDYDGTFLAAAGLNRLGLMKDTYELMPVDLWVPAVGQGAIGIQHRNNDKLAKDIVESISHKDSFFAIKVERAFLRGFGGSCTTPVGAYCDGVHLIAWTIIETNDKNEQLEQLFDKVAIDGLSITCACDRAYALGREMAFKRSGSYDTYNKAL
jgi:hydroxymethylbilane synthase